MKPVVTLTMNPALDLNTSVEQVVSGHKMRCGPGRLDPGGGGVNVARVVRRLGGEALVVYTVGGPTGELYEKLLEAEGAACRPVPIADNTRQDFTADETGTGKQYRFVLQGPELSEPEWRSCLDALAKQIVPDAYVVASGSLPPGVPDDFYRRVARLVKQRGARCVIDTSGAALQAALDEAVFLVKPNRRELQGLTGAALDTPEQQESALRQLVQEGRCELVALTLGAAGAVFAWSEGVIRLPAPAVTPRSAVGAGDSFLGALVLRLAEERPLVEAFRHAMAAGAAALLTPATELCRREDVERMDCELKSHQGRSQRRSP